MTGRKDPFDEGAAPPGDAAAEPADDMAPPSWYLEGGGEPDIPDMFVTQPLPLVPMEADVPAPPPATSLDQVVANHQVEAEFWAGADSVARPAADPQLGVPGGLQGEPFSPRRLVRACVALVWAGWLGYLATLAWVDGSTPEFGISVWLLIGGAALAVVVAAAAFSSLHEPHLLQEGEAQDFHDINCRCRERYAPNAADIAQALVLLVPPFAYFART